MILSWKTLGIQFSRLIPVTLGPLILFATIRLFVASFTPFALIEIPKRPSSELDSIMLNAIRLPLAVPEEVGIKIADTKCLMLLCVITQLSPPLFVMP